MRRLGHTGEIRTVESDPPSSARQPKMQKSDVTVPDEKFRVAAEAGKRDVRQEPPAAVSAPYADYRFDFGVQYGFRQVLEPIQIRSGKIALLFEDILAGRHVVSGCPKDIDSLFVLIDFERPRWRYETNHASLAEASVSRFLAHLRIMPGSYSGRN